MNLVMKCTLTPKERNRLLKQHKNESSHKVADRIKAVLLSNDGMSQWSIAKVLFLNEGTVARHILNYLNEQKLTNNSGGSSGKLDLRQTAELMTHLDEKTYTNAKKIISYIQDKYDVKYSHSGMINWLHQHNYSFKQPAKVPSKADPALQAAFIKEYLKIKASLPNYGVLLFGDGVHPTMQTKVSHGWIATGKNKSIPTTASRTRVNLFGAVELGNMDFIYDSYETINSQYVCDFLDKLKLKYPSKEIHLVLDRGSYNKSEETLSYAEKLGIKIHLLPPYSPNLNPIERIWKVMNEHVRNNVFFKSAKDFRRSIFSFFDEKWDTIKSDMKSRINDNFQTLKSDIFI